MTTKIVRKIVIIDEEKCDGCGLCVPSCVEGALQIINGKAKLISETYCDGLGACLGECPQGAITIEERVSDPFDGEATNLHLGKEAQISKETLPCECPSATVTQFEKNTRIESATQNLPRVQSALTQWPVQLMLVPPNAPFLQGANIVLAGDCTPFAYGNFHRDFIKDHALLVACPKLDNFEAHQEKLNAILKQPDIKSITVVRMEVPCCSGLVHMAKQAIKFSGKPISLREVIIGIRGEVM